MKSKITLLVILFCLVGARLFHLQHFAGNHYKVTTWDAFGYYMYLPSAIIYKDTKALKWVPKIDSQYQVTGGNFYQAIPLEKGNYTNKYLCGVSILQLPYFLVGHTFAYLLAYPPDGFSPPYQYAIMFGAIFWAMIGFVFLRKVLLRYFDDGVTAATLLLIVLCSNLIQYIAIDAAQSHVYIFSLYALVLWLTVKWHDKPLFTDAFLIGIVCGLATIARPTEMIILFIPLLWGMNTPESKKEKWALVAQHKKQILLCCVGGFIALAPQLFYWHYTTGTWVYDVGSKWYFFNPWFRVLVGSEKGWFIYTPIAIAMVLGLFWIKKYPFQKSVITFCVLNIWIIIAWADWRYGGSYSTRALTQSYPVFALALAAVLNRVMSKKNGGLCSLSA
ncbi:MAG: hypothetical protein QM530_01505 [Phycisphaerales bacterium]|nr:hypothetical protein [Phycisphaerales bacterium]